MILLHIILNCCYVAAITINFINPLTSYGYYFLLHITFSKTTNINLSAIDHFLLFLCIYIIYFIYTISQLNTMYIHIQMFMYT